MSHFSDVDRSPDVDRLVAALEKSDRGLTAMKSYIVAAAASAVPAGGLVLDVGCGVGHDLARLEAAGLAAVGVDLSLELLRRATSAASALVRADGAALPFAGESFDGCRMERVLQHVVDPATLLNEAARVVRPGGFLAVFDFAALHVESDVQPDGSYPLALMVARHPTIGGELADLVDGAGFRVDDIVTEASRGYSFESLPVDVERIMRRAADEGRVDGARARQWLDEQRSRSSSGSFRAGWDKVLVVAVRT